jgi:hypothetical protein
MPRRDFTAFHPSLTDDEIHDLIAPLTIEAIDRTSHIVLFACDDYDDAAGVRARFDRQRDEYEKGVREAVDAESQKRYEEYLKGIDLTSPIEIPATVLHADGTKEQTIYLG